MIGHFKELALAGCAQHQVIHLLSQRRAHAHQPLIVFCNADAVGVMPHAQARVASLLHVQWRAAEPAAQRI